MKIRFVIKTGCVRVRGFLRTAGRLVLMLAAAGLAPATLSAQTDFVTLGNAKAHPTRILAKYKDQVILEASSNIVRQAGSRQLRRYRQLPQLAVLEATDSVPGDNEVTRRNRLIQRINDLKRTGLFEYVEPDYLVETSLVPTDQAFTDGTLWGLRNTGQDGGMAGADIAAPAAWDITTGSAHVIVAVIDTGIRYSHRDLTNQMWRNPGESGGGKETNGIDDDNDGYVDDVFGINARTGSGNPMDVHGHGTHVAGTIGAAANDGNPHVGVTWGVRLMACKFLAPSGAISDAIECIDFAVSKGAKILNNSWGGGGFSTALYDSINNARKKGVLFVAAAGNNSTDNDQLPHYPSNYNLDNVISVAALTRTDELADFSNFGRTTVDLGAPGEEIYSCWSTSDTAYDTIAGTSMAAPHVSGVAALILSLFPTADLAEVRQRLYLGTVPIPALTGFCTTGGRLNAYNSLTVYGSSGVLQVSVDPPSGATLLAGSSQPIFVSVTDLAGVTDATVTGSITGGGTLTFRNDGVSPDAVAGNHVYSALLAVPAATNPVTLTVTVSAPGKIGSTSVVTYNVVPPPPNDYFTNATKVPSGGRLYLANNQFATLETGEPKPAGVTTAAGSLWWAWTPVNTTDVFVDTTGSAIDTVLAVYTNNTLATLGVVAAANNVGLRKQGYVSFNAQGGTAYRITVASANTNSMGSLQMRVTPGGQFDTTPPQVLVTAPLNGASVTTNLIYVTGIAADPEPNATGVSDVFVAVNGDIAYTAAGTTNWTAPVLLQPGFNEIVVTALDAAGNVSPSVTIQVSYFVNNPGNDVFVNAIALPGAAGTDSSISTTNATKEVGEPNHAGNGGGKSVWWTFQPTVDGVLTLDTTNSSFDTLLGLYTGDHVNSLTTIASNDDAYPGAPGGFSSLTVAVRSNQVYRIAVDGYGGVSGSVVLRYSFTSAQLFRLTINSTPGGTTSPTSLDVQSNTTVSVSALASPGYVFDQWDGDVVSFANPVSVLVRGNLAITARFRAITYTDGFESGNFTALGWTTGGNEPWIVQNTNVAAGTFAARSGVIGPSQTSSLFLGGSYRAGLGSFFLRVNSELGWDFLSFHLDGIQQSQWSGDVGWTSFTFPLSAGAHTLEWRYAKDPNVNFGMDAAFLDNVNLPVLVGVDGSTPAQLQIHRESDGTVFITLTGQTNQLYLLQASTDLITWQTISTNVAVGGFIQVVDPASDTLPARFYRAVVLVP